MKSQCHNVNGEVNMAPLSINMFAGLIVVAAGIITLLYYFTKKTGGEKDMPLGGPAKKYNNDGSISQQWLAEEIARQEGKEEQVNIGQIKEQLRITLDILAELKKTEHDKLIELLEKHGG